MKWQTPLLIFIFALLSAPSNAQVGFRGLEDTPLSEFSEEDLALFENAQKEALESGADGDTVSWSNPETGASGTVTPLRTDRTNDRRCRLLRIVIGAGGRSGESRFW